MNNRYRLEINFKRKIRVTAFGSEAYHVDRLSQEYTYGLNKNFKNSQEGLEKLTTWALQFRNDFSEISITIWNGYNGVGRIIHQSDEMFDNSIRNLIWYAV
jgi:hypothetical protein